MKKYRIKTVRCKLFGMRYYAQVRWFFVYNDIDFNGKTSIVGYGCVTREDALELINMHKDRRKRRRDEYEYID
jgi:hypothetical protein